jgi:hypothetical protein
MHSDASVTPVDPLFCMWTATARKTMSGRVLGRMSVSPFRRPPHAVTLGAAYSLADFTVLDRNPLDVASPDELRDIYETSRCSAPSWAAKPSRLVPSAKTNRPEEQSAVVKERPGGPRRAPWSSANGPH